MDVAFIAHVNVAPLTVFIVSYHLRHGQDTGKLANRHRHRPKTPATLPHTAMLLVSIPTNLTPFPLKHQPFSPPYATSTSYHLQETISLRTRPHTAMGHQHMDCSSLHTAHASVNTCLGCRHRRKPLVSYLCNGLPCKVHTLSLYNTTQKPHCELVTHISCQGSIQITSTPGADTTLPCPTPSKRAPLVSQWMLARDVP